MDLPKYAAMSGYWAVHPPLHLMVQGYLGIEMDKKESPGDGVVNRSSDLEEFLSMFSSAGGAMN